jgi:hypothetical protein
MKYTLPFVMEVPDSLCGIPEIDVTRGRTCRHELRRSESRDISGKELVEFSNYTNLQKIFTMYSHTAGHLEYNSGNSADKSPTLFSISTPICELASPSTCSESWEAQKITGDTLLVSSKYGYLHLIVRRSRK